MSAVELTNVFKRYGRTEVLKDICLSMSSGEFITLLGPSGCGKTTLLRIIAGFEDIQSGSVRIDGTEVSRPNYSLPPEKRGIGIVPQNYALWPHMSVMDNVGYGLKVAGLPAGPRKERVLQTLQLVGMEGMTTRRPADLSGGQRQRVALARCLAMEAGLILLDEPLANLDIHLRSAMEAEFADFHDRSGASMLYVTHDQAEAMALADRVAVVDNGEIVQFAPPRELFHEPANDMVARFIGDGCVVEVEQLVPLGDGRAKAILMGSELTLRCAPGETRRPRAKICLHSNNLELLDRDGGSDLARNGGNSGSDISGPPSEGKIRATVSRTSYRGGHIRAELLAGPASEIALSIQISDQAPLEIGQRVTLSLREGWVIPNRPAI